MAFRVGQKVVCVDSSPGEDPRVFPGSYWLPNFPVEGEVYTVRAISDRGGILCEEIMNPIRPWCDGTFEGEFRSSRFRPVVERKTDISIFTAMLNPSKQTVGAH